MHIKEKRGCFADIEFTTIRTSRGIPTVQYLEPCVSRLPPVSFYRVSRLFCVSGPVRACVLSVVEIWVSRLPPVSFYPAPPGVFLPGSPRCLLPGTGTCSRPRGAVDSGLAAVLAAVESVAVFVRVCVVGFGWMEL